MCIIKSVCLIYKNVIRSRPLHIEQLKRSAFFQLALRTTSSMQSSQERSLIGVCQFTGKEDKTENIETCHHLIKRAAANGAKMVFLPEACDYIAESIASSVAMSEPIDGPTISSYREIARETGVWLSLGFHQKSETDPQRVYNSHIVISSDGEIKSTYLKVHLFDIDIKDKVRLCESNYTIPGPSINKPIPTPIGQLGLGTCYDLRFPEMSILLRHQGADILTYPSAFTPTTGDAHWEVLLRSRAIENQCYVVAAAHVGQHNNKRSSYGNAMVVDPWGKIVAHCKEGTDICFADINLDYLHKIRKDMPVEIHKRKDLYQLSSPRLSLTSPGIDDRLSYVFGQYNIASTQVFYRTHLTYAFVNIKPVVHGHLLVSPFRKVKRFGDLTTEETGDLFEVTRKVSQVCEKHFGSTALTIAIQDGSDAGQSVDHVHVHILPRKPNDFPFNDSVYNELQKHDENLTTSKDLRTEGEMKAEAAELRPYFI